MNLKKRELKVRIALGPLPPQPHRNLKKRELKETLTKEEEGRE